MPFFPLSHPRIGQPHGTDSNAGAFGYEDIFCLLSAASGPYEFVHRKAWATAQEVSLLPSSAGLEAVPGSSSAVWHNPVLSSGSIYDKSAPPLTIFGIGRVTANSLDVFISRGNGSGIPAWSVGGWYGTYRGAYGQVKTSGGSIAFQPLAAFLDPSTRPVVSVLTVGVATTTIYCAYMGSAEILDERSQSTPSGDFYYESGDNFRCVSVGGRFSAATPFVMAGAASTEWSKEKVLRFISNPWSVFAHDRRLVILPSGLSVLPTLSAATAINITGSGFQPRVTATY